MGSRFTGLCVLGVALAGNGIGPGRNSIAAAEPAAVPATQPAQPGRLETPELKAKAQLAFSAGDYKAATPLLKELAVRLRNTPEAVAPILEQIRVAEAGLQQEQPAAEGINAPRTPHPPLSADEIRELPLQKLGNFTYDANVGGNIPADVKALSGGVFKLKGFMLPIDEAGDRISRFVLVPDLFACCFGQPPQIQHTVTVICPPGKAVAYYPDEIFVTGKLTVEEKSEDGFITSIFTVDVTSVKPAPQ